MPKRSKADVRFDGTIPEVYDRYSRPADIFF